MKKLNNKLKYRIIQDDEGNCYAEIWGTRIDTGKRAIFGTCHPASIPLLKANFKANVNLIRIT